jgi:hypothetical protein
VRNAGEADRATRTASTEGARFGAAEGATGVEEVMRGAVLARRRA